ncbi:MAG: hypothetical protein IH623_08620 [Verrucomicrobia bacterium]|nr:hypothetical protein [Verrucomicrobiota bacterium]
MNDRRIDQASVVTNQRDLVPRSRRRTWTWLCALGPCFLVLAFVTFGLHLRLTCGEWPDGDWKSLHFTFQENFLLRLHQGVLDAALLFAAFAALPLWLGFLCFRSLRLSAREHGMQVLAGVLGWCAMLATVLIAPPKYLAWFLT